MVTPAQMKNLGRNYDWHGEINCYLSVPDSTWKPMTVDGIGWQMLFCNPKPSDEANPFFEFQKTRKIYVWIGPGLFTINTSDVETPVLCIFPYVSIEEFNNQDFSEMVIAVTKNAKLGFENLNVQFTRLGQVIRVTGQMLRDLAQKLSPSILYNLTAQPAASFQCVEKSPVVLREFLDFMNGILAISHHAGGVPPALSRQEGSGQLVRWGPLRNPQSEPDTESQPNIYFEQVLAGIQERYESQLPPPNSDSSSFWASQLILQGFQLIRKIPESSFQLSNVEKKENVFYLKFRTIFHPSNATSKINWEQEFILIGTGKSTLLVQTSSPWSADKRGVTERSWIAAWLDGLKVPLEQQ